MAATPQVVYVLTIKSAALTDIAKAGEIVQRMLTQRCGVAVGDLPSTDCFKVFL
jgi:hypothetical protein